VTCSLKKDFGIAKAYLDGVGGVGKNEVYVNHPPVEATGKVLAVDFRDVSGQVMVYVNPSTVCNHTFSFSAGLYTQTLTNTRSKMRLIQNIGVLWTSSRIQCR
jgi:hypothetical protein